MLMLLRLPRTRIVDYYLHLLLGVPSGHARRRLAMLSCHDPSITERTLAVRRRIHLIGALSGNGKLGVVCVAANRAAAAQLYQNTAKVLDEAAG